MKKLICAAIVAGSMCALAEEAANAVESVPVAAAEAAKPAAESAKVAPRRQQLSSEQREKMREQREKFMAERKAKMQAQLLEVVKKYVPEEEKAQALVKEIQELRMPGSRNMPRRHPKPGAEKPAEAK